MLYELTNEIDVYVAEKPLPDVSARLENHLLGLIMLETELRPLIEIQEFGQLLKKPTDFQSLSGNVIKPNVLFGAVLLQNAF